MHRLPLALLVVASLAQAQGFELERLDLNVGAKQTMLAQTGDALEAMALRVQLLGHYEHRPLLYTVDGVEAGAVVGSRVTTHLLAAFGMHRYLEASLQLPVVVSQSGDDLTPYGLSAVPGLALGAPRLGLRSAFLRQDDGQPLDLGLSVALHFPFGAPAAFTRDPQSGFAFAPKLGAGRSFGPVRVGLEAGALIRGQALLSSGNLHVTDEVGNQFSGALAVSTVGLPVHLELTGRLTAPFTRTALSAEVLAAVRYTFIEQLELSLLGGPGFGRAPGTPAFRLALGVAWTPRF